MDVKCECSAERGRRVMTHLAFSVLLKSTVFAGGGAATATRSIAWGLTLLPNMDLIRDTIHKQRKRLAYVLCASCTLFQKSTDASSLGLLRTVVLIE